MCLMMAQVKKALLLPNFGEGKIRPLNFSFQNPSKNSVSGLALDKLLVCLHSIGKPVYMRG